MPTFYPLSRIIQRIDELLRPAMEKPFWIKAELNSVRVKSGSLYCDLIETDSEGRMVTQVKCTCWSRDLSLIRANFRASGLDFNIEDGLVVGVQCRVQFHPVYGLSFRLIDMDPAFALGEMELRKKALIEKLQKEGLDKKNKVYQLPPLIFRIGLITSRDSAAYHDFMQTIESSGFGIKVLIADSTMQGKDTELSITKSLMQLEKLKVDVVVIIRGGGSKTDLSWLDNEVLAVQIANYATPIWTGIGHEIDTSVLDIVSNRNFKTPTAVAEEIVGSFDNMNQYLEQASYDIRSNWKKILKQQSLIIDHSKEKLISSVKNVIKIEGRELESKKTELEFKVKSFLKGNRQNIELISKQFYYGVQNKLNQTSEKISTIKTKIELNSKIKIQKKQIEKQQLIKRLNYKTLSPHLERKRSSVQMLTLKLKQTESLNKLKIHKEKLNAYQKLIKNADPQNNLKKGYAILSRIKDKKYKPGDEIYIGDMLSISTAKGEIKSQVVEINKNNS